MNVRKCQEDVVQVLELPMPFQYFHIMSPGASLAQVSKC